MTRRGIRLAAMGFGGHRTMLAPRSPTSPARAPLPAPVAPAILLNAHAKRVTPRVRAAVEATVGPEHVVLSSDVAEAGAIATRVLRGGYRTIFAAGGDGTFVGWVSRIVREAERLNLPVPRFGILALGTGNAVAGLVGTGADTWLEDLKKYLRGGCPGSLRIDLVDCEGRHTPFAGVGADAALINDYDWLKARLRGTPLRSLGHGPAGFGLAAAFRTAPRHLLAPTTRCEIVNAGAPAWRLDGDGKRVGEAVREGGTLYEGPCMMAAVSTVPYYGLGMRAFPFAGVEPGKLHLRVAARIPVPVVLLNLPTIWTGEFRHEGLIDFEVERVTIRLDRPAPLQIGGDAEGYRETVTMGVIANPIEIVDFSAVPQRA